MSKKIVKEFLENELKADPQQDPIWFTSLEYEDGNFTMDIEDVLLSFKKYYDGLVYKSLMNKVEDSKYKVNFIIDIMDSVDEG